jgi:hypothetical protein
MFLQSSIDVDRANHLLRQVFSNPEPRVRRQVTATDYRADHLDFSPDVAYSQSVSTES